MFKLFQYVLLFALAREVGVK